MIYYATQRRPPEDSGGSGATPAFDGSMLDAPNWCLWDDSGQALTFSSTSPVSPVHNDNPNSSLGRPLAPYDQLVDNRDVSHSTPFIPALPAQPAELKNQIIPLAQLFPEHQLAQYSTITALDRYFKFAGKIYRRDAMGFVQLHEAFIVTPSTIVSPASVVPGSVFSIGDLTFHVDVSGGLFKFGDSVEIVEVFDNEAAAWASLGISMAAIAYWSHPQGPLSPPLPATPSSSGAPGCGLDQTVYTPETLSPDSPPALSPASSNSSGYDSSLGLDLSPEHAPLLVDPSLGRPPPQLAVPGPPTRVMAKLSEAETRKKHEIDVSVDASVKRGEQHVCCLCQKVERRPSELKEHLYGHSSIKPFKCSHCPYDSNRATNVNRHVKSCRVGQEIVIETSSTVA
ncbi:hypothetical protein FRC08_003552 [Ceratobasidium sp. 394]|nr:hypothetical protein FRC08_003552 [Ceratobasidium sp. 394]